MMLGGQQLGLGVAESNIAAAMRGGRGGDGLAMTLDQHQQHQEPNQSQQASENGGDDKK
jgi:hypothetical protein